MKKILLVDGNPLQWRAANSKDESFVAEGIVKYFFDIVEKTDVNEALVVWDSGKSFWRSKAFPEYKAQRMDRMQKFDMQEIQNQKITAKSILESFGVRNISVYGIEADDLISWLSEYFSTVVGYDQVVIATSDHDLWQLVNNVVLVYDSMRGHWITEGLVEKGLGVPPLLIPDWKAIVGDVSDNIKGVNGLGEKTATKLVKELGGIASLLNPRNRAELKKSKSSSKILEQSSDLEFCYQLVKLPVLQEARYFFNDRRFNDVLKSLIDPVKIDPIKANLELRCLTQNSTINSRFISQSEKLNEFIEYVRPVEKELFNELSDVDLAVSMCSSCPLRFCCGENGPTLSEGRQSASVMVVGRNPTEEEMLEGKPFMGKCGEFVDQFLEDVGLSRSRCWLTNACKCYSTNNRPITQGEVLACSGFLRAEIDLVKPKFIIALGNEAMSLVSPYGSGIFRRVGEILEKPTGLIGEVAAYVAIMPHPSTILRSGSRMSDWEFGAGKIKEFLDKKRGK